MRALLDNLTTGALCKVNLAVALAGPLSALTLEEKARIFAALATGLWFSLQIIFSLRDRWRKRRGKKPD